MICSFTLYLKPLEIGNKIIKFKNYESFINLFKNNGFSSEELKKIVISNFLTKDKIIENKNYSIKISAVDENVIIKMFRVLFLKKLEKNFLRINGTNFVIVNIYTNNKYSKQLKEGLENYTYEIKDILTLKILTPMMFKVGDEIMTTIDFKYLLKNIGKKLSKSSIKNWKEYIPIIDNLEVLVVENNTKNVILNNSFESTIGEIKYLIKTENIELAKIKFLFNFAIFSGIGYMSEKGYGQIEIL